MNYFLNAQFPPPHVPADHAPTPPATPAPAAGGAWPLDPFNDRVLWSFAQGNNNATATIGNSNEVSTPVGKTPAGPSGSMGSLGPRELIGKDVADASSKRPVVILPETPPMYSCTVAKFLGRSLILTAIIQRNLNCMEDLGSSVTECRPYEMSDFTKRSLVEVKEFLQQYMDERRLGRCMMSEDPLTSYYEAVCIGLMGDPMNSEDFFDVSTDSETHLAGVSYQKVQGKSRAGCSIDEEKPSLTEQRERAAMLTVLDVVAYFHMPIEKSSKRLMLWPTVVKKICRRGGVKRWSYRKVKSLNDKITKLRRKLKMSNLEDRACIQAQIQSALQEVSVICFRVTRVNR